MQPCVLACSLLTSQYNAMMAASMGLVAVCIQQLAQLLVFYMTMLTTLPSLKN